MRVCYDAAYPNPRGIPGTDTVLIYSGGDTPHIWTPAEIAEQPERWRLPCYVRSNAGNPSADAASMLTWLKQHGAPTGTATVLDLETRVDPAYVSAYGNYVRSAGYLVLPYGSESTLFDNPQLDGYFLALPGAKTVDPRSVMTQFGYFGGYDLSWIADSVPLWDTSPTPLPTPAPLPPVTVITLGDGKMRYTLEVPLDKDGNGYLPTIIEWSIFEAVTLQGADPAPGADHVYWHGSVSAQNRGGCVLVQVVGATERALQHAEVYVLVSPA